MLLFKKKFLPLIRSGQKTQTIRVWKFARMRAGQRSYIPGIGYIGIDAVDPVQIESLSEADAVLDGFENAASLRAELAELYGEKLADGHAAYRVRFRVFSPEEQEKATQERQAVKAAERAKAAVK